jgi:hypothetical protein
MQKVNEILATTSLIISIIVVLIVVRELFLENDLGYLVNPMLLFVYIPFVSSILAYNFVGRYNNILITFLVLFAFVSSIVLNLSFFVVSMFAAI